MKENNYNCTSEFCGFMKQLCDSSKKLDLVKNWPKSVHRRHRKE